MPDLTLRTQMDDYILPDIKPPIKNEDDYPSPPEEDDANLFLDTDSVDISYEFPEIKPISNCPVTFTSSTLPQSKAYQCSTCQKEFEYKSRLIAHEQMHNPMPCICCICKKTFARQQLLSKHKVHAHKITWKHTDKEILLQFCCNKAYRYSSEYKRHIKCHEEGPGKYKCDICKKEFHHVSNFRRHTKRKTPCNM